MASSISELEENIRNACEKAMKNTEHSALAALKAGTVYFYSGGSPVMYERTLNFSSTPEIGGQNYGGNTMSFYAGMRQSPGYVTGKRPTMLQVLHLTNEGRAPGLRPAVGRTGWWEKSLELIEQDFEKNFRSVGFK